jgi:GntR family transcriptional repressor for pyruvate dehydrogenase complex
VAEARTGRRQAADLPGIRPVSLPRVSDEVAEQIRRLIVSEPLAEGARLPAERDLADRFGVSRPMVSQALRMLSLMGLVEIRRGSGAYVLRRPQTMVTASVGLLLDLHGSIGELAELRLWLETLGVVHAARLRLAPTGTAGIADALQRLAGSTGSASAWIAADTVFHATAVGSAGNTYLSAMYEGVHTAVLSHEYEHWVRTETEPAWLAPSGAPALLDLHRAIYEAVAASDAEAARTAVLRHHHVMLEHLAVAREQPVAPPGRGGQ